MMNKNTIHIKELNKQIDHLRKKVDQINGISNKDMIIRLSLFIKIQCLEDERYGDAVELCCASIKRKTIKKV